MPAPDASRPGPGAALCAFVNKEERGGSPGSSGDPGRRSRRRNLQLSGKLPLPPPPPPPRSRVPPPPTSGARRPRRPAGRARRHLRSAGGSGAASGAGARATRGLLGAAGGAGAEPARGAAPAGGGAGTTGRAAGNDSRPWFTVRNKRE
ncbi:collagen alpha-2(I) chain-like [Prinia subflava]|uniref:collagen alpha-2(I) chain-like n=1 Tax=Prinia subflava TaxID=208062 RepID=UPI002FE1B42E